MPGDDQTLMWLYRPEQSRAEQTAGSALQRSAAVPVCVMVHTADYIIHQRAEAERST